MFDCFMKSRVLEMESRVPGLARGGWVLADVRFYVYVCRVYVCAMAIAKGLRLGGLVKRTSVGLLHCRGRPGLHAGLSGCRQVSDV